LFKHALVQDAAYGTLLREPRRALHARIGDTLESDFADIVESQPQVLARHCTEAGLTEKAASLWGKAGQRSLSRSALVEAIEQFTRALAQIATLPATPALRREQIKLQAALITPLMHVKGYAASETKSAIQQARLLIEQAKALGEPPEDPLLLFSILFGFWVMKQVAFDGDAVSELAAQFLALAEKQAAEIPQMIGHRLVASSLLLTGDMAKARDHFDRAVAFYVPTKHRVLATRFGLDARVSALTQRAMALWGLGHACAALADIDLAIKEAREIGQAPTLMHALTFTSMTLINCGDYATTNAQSDELIALADEKGAALWKAYGMLLKGRALAMTNRSLDAIQMIDAGVVAYRSTGATLGVPTALSDLARAYAALGKYHDAWRSINEAVAMIEKTKERWAEAEVDRTAGEIALKSPERDTAKAEAYFDRALAVAREQQAKSWELRAAMSLARLWRDQGKVQQARELLAPVYGWFTEGFDTRDPKEAKALLEQLVT
jgi:predicted ATPase